jgi:hypothetical protein
MRFLKLDHLLPNPFTKPTWVQTVGDATPFETRGGARAAKLKMGVGSGIIYEEQHWYVVKVQATDLRFPDKIPMDPIS